MVNKKQKKGKGDLETVVPFDCMASGVLFKEVA